MQLIYGGGALLVVALGHVAQCQALTDKEILVKVFEAAGGSNWTHAHKWTETDNVCNWFGIVCDSETPPDGFPIWVDDDQFNDDDAPTGDTPGNRRRMRSWRRLQDGDDDDTPGGDTVFDDDNINDDGPTSTAQSGAIMAIRLGGNNLVGTLAPEIFDIETLKELDLKDNPDLRVALDGVGKLKDLQTLYLSDVHMNKNGLVGIGEASNLRELHLTNNGFAGAMPEELFNLTLLDSLFIAFNDFEGEFPKGLYKMNLTELWAYDNLFSGPLPDDIDVGMPYLKHLVLGGNAFTGTIPAAFGKLQHLRQLSIRNLRDTMELAGPGLSGNLPSFSDLRHIKALHLNHNNFTGPLPADLLKNLRYPQKNLSVNLTSNMLTGVVPLSYSRFAKLSLDVTANRLTGFEDGLCDANITKWMDGYVATLGCEAIMCGPNAANDIGRATPNDTCITCELPEGFTQWDDDGADDDDDSITDDDGRRALQTTPADIPPDITPYFGKVQCEYLDTDGSVLDKTGDEVADLESYTGERAILQELYDALGGPNWDYSDHWLTDDKGICVWYGITCGVVDGPNAGDMAVERINLDGNNLVGTLPASVWNLPDLKELSIMRNQVTMTYQNIENATQLENLFMEGIILNSLDGVEKATGLKKLIISDNGLTGPFPTNLFGLERLQEFMLDDNEFTGTLPAEISGWSKMTRFDVTRNKMNGQLPSFRKWKDLRVLDLSDNQWTGTLPESLADMENLEVLAIYGKGVSAIGGPLLDFADCPNLMEIYLEDNQLTGTISHQFLASNNNTNKTIYVALSRNNLSGTVPAELARFERMTLTLDDNQITEIAPAICDQGKWMEGEVKQYGCQAVLCPQGTYHGEIGRATKLLGDCKSCAALTSVPYLGNTQCGTDGGSGTTGGDDTANLERDILMAFYDATGGPNWDDNKNWGNKTVGICEWYGITCADEPNNVQSDVIRIELMDNGLVGSIIPDLYKLPVLNEIDLDKNGGLQVNFKGVEQAANLERFRMSGTQVDLTDIDKATKLAFIDCANAGLTGPIPEQLYNMKQITSLELTSNSLTGGIPHKIENWVNITDLYLDNNQFTGTLTTHIGKLTMLKELAISRNKLEGPLPSELNKLVDLELFSAKEQLGDNGLPTLSGNIPSFHNSPHLNEIYLQGNALNGNIPDNFLESSEARTSDSYVVYIGLDDNRLEGTIPESLGGIKNLIIDINDNFIEKIPDSLCKITAWQNGGVGDYGCDAILCPKGKYVAPTGRQVKDSAPCQKCNVEGGAQFMGSTRCISLAEMETRPVLIDMYNQLGGNEWWSNENWLSEEADVCSWYGVNCTEDKSVTGIFLGSNNLKGTLSPDFWTIPGLATVWLYSNPELVITFDGIEKATFLKTLLIDATGLTSLEGLENAKSLEELDLRFNNLKGPFPYRQISELKSLTTLSLANSGLTGTLNSYGLGEKKNLKKLRLGGNELDGPLPDFSDFPKLESLDLSDNFFTGRIPDDFLKDIADPSKPITVDLAMNKLAGTIPSGPFMKFKDLTLYLRENEFIELATDLCTKDKWNGGDVGKYGCDGLLCPRGTFSESGRQKSDDTPCEKCDLPTSFFMGAVECALQATTLRVESAATGYSLVWTVAISVLGLMGSLLFLGEI